ncbi:hypothetical protein GXM_06337 [Nostoc sphaeroides CCNUC1]|uniref:Uncharacterized protein n=1 Tax=Nostoc sphaeroides CCNUC1 TaxID=2653204 RepID=A0A5P8W7T8_9NOSO|nr:hypothetical protein GXM_06337 [Nostoc sphaeroides CCNUC1]
MKSWVTLFSCTTFVVFSVDEFAPPLQPNAKKTIKPDATKQRRKTMLYLQNLEDDVKICSFFEYCQNTVFLLIHLLIFSQITLLMMHRFP